MSVLTEYFVADRDQGARFLEAGVPAKADVPCRPFKGVLPQPVAAALGDGEGLEEIAGAEPNGPWVYAFAAPLLPHFASLDPEGLRAIAVLLEQEVPLFGAELDDWIAIATDLQSLARLAQERHQDLLAWVCL